VLDRFLRRIIPERYRPIGYLTDMVRRGTNSTVRLGPFAGMRYVDHAFGSAYLPKLLGIYERELAPVIEFVCSCKPPLIVDIGAAEGYYAVGLALRLPETRIIAFEREAQGRRALSRMLRLNGICEHVEVLGDCAPWDLEKVLQEGRSSSAGSPAVVICDTEGDEAFLLDTFQVPMLRDAMILAETHEFLKPGITQALIKGFAQTHRIEQIWQSERTIGDFPFNGPRTWLLPGSYIRWAVSEWRPERMCWLWMQPNNRNAR